MLFEPIASGGLSPATRLIYIAADLYSITNFTPQTIISPKLGFTVRRNLTKGSSMIVLCSVIRARYAHVCSMGLQSVSPNLARLGEPC